MDKVKIYCCGCKQDTEARLTDGSEVYPHRKDLYSLPFWKCDKCGNFVGCHHKTKDRTRPLGCIPTQEIKAARQKIHRVLDPLWQSGKFNRKELYAKITDKFGWRYHTAKIRSVEEAEDIFNFIKRIEHMG